MSEFAVRIVQILESIDFKERVLNNLPILLYPGAQASRLQ